MSDEELVKKVSPTNAILKEVFREEIEKQDRAIKEIFRQTQAELKEDSFKVECSKLGMAGCGCFTKEDLMEVGNGFLMQRPKLKEEELCFKCKEYLTDERIAKLKGEKNE